MIMKTNLRKMILWTIALLAISIMTTSSVNPGYDEFGNDINVGSRGGDYEVNKFNCNNDMRICNVS